MQKCDCVHQNLFSANVCFSQNRLCLTFCLSKTIITIKFFISVMNCLYIIAPFSQFPKDLNNLDQFPTRPALPGVDPSKTLGIFICWVFQYMYNVCWKNISKFLYFLLVPLFKIIMMNGCLSLGVTPPPPTPISFWAEIKKIIDVIHFCLYYIFVKML